MGGGGEKREEGKERRGKRERVGDSLWIKEGKGLEKRNKIEIQKPEDRKINTECEKLKVMKDRKMKPEEGRLVDKVRRIKSGR